MADSRRIMADLRAKMDRIARSVAVDALDSAVRETPVDTGEAAGGWTLAVGQADTTHDRKRRAGGGTGRGTRGRSRLRRGQGGDDRQRDAVHRCARVRAQPAIGRDGTEDGRPHPRIRTRRGGQGSRQVTRR